MSEHMLIQGDAVRLPLPDQSVGLVFGSPPYVDARLYLEDGKDLKISRQCAEWVEWMLRVTEECLRVSRGAVVWIASGVTRGRNYWPACEGLMWRWYERGGHAYRPCYWRRSGIPGSGGDQWFRADVEYAMCFKRSGALPWADNTVMGHPPKWAPGGKFSHYTASGNRVNAITVSGERRINGEKQGYVNPDLANPGNFIKTLTGGGHLGFALTHANEAPFPEPLAEFFVRSLCPEGGRVLDPFSGSGTTAAVCRKVDRHAIGADIRMSQCRLGERRIADGLRPVSRLDTRAMVPLDGQTSMF